MNKPFSEMAASLFWTLSSLPQLIKRAARGLSQLLIRNKKQSSAAEMMNKDSFVPDHVPEERAPLPLRRSLEWVQDLPPSCSGRSAPFSHSPAWKSSTVPRQCPCHRSCHCHLQSPFPRQQRGTANNTVYLFPLPSGNCFKESNKDYMALEVSKNGNTFKNTIWLHYRNGNGGYLGEAISIFVREGRRQRKRDLRIFCLCEASPDLSLRITSEFSAQSTDMFVWIS